MDLQAVLQAVDAVEAQEPAERDEENTHPLSEEKLTVRNTISNEFIKVQGTDARPEEITSILSKVKDEFLKEAREEILGWFGWK